MRPANRTGWIGRANYAEAGTVDNWGSYEDGLAALRTPLGFGELTVLPFAPPFDQGSSVLVGERTTLHERAGYNYEQAYLQGGERYYGFPFYAHDNARDPSNAANWGPGYLDALMGGTSDLYAGSLPIDYMPDLVEPPPWERDGLFA